jgi:hypothetical protein
VGFGNWDVVITLIIAVYGALISTIKVIYDRSKHTRRLKVKLVSGFISQGGFVEPEVLFLTAVNVGFTGIILNSVGFLLPDNKKTAIVRPNSYVRFPHTLSGGNKCEVWKGKRQFARELKEHGFSGKIKIKGYYGTATGKTFKSKAKEFDIDGILAKET